MLSVRPLPYTADNVEVARLFVEEAEDVGVETATGLTPLHIAAYAL